MSYCVNCGVELDASARACPLCGTPVVNPRAPVQPDAPLPFPERRAEVAPVDRRGAGLTVTVMLAAAAACCAVLNRFFFFPEVPWSAYAVGGIFVFWVLVVSPLLWRAHPAARAALSIAAALAYTALVAFLTHGWGWYVRLALPVALAVCAAAAVPCVTAAMHRSILAVTMSALAALTVFLVVLEALIDVFLTGRFAPGWSLICAAVGVVMVATLIVVRLRPRLREEVRKRFHI